MGSFRHLPFDYEYHTTHLLYFTQLACILILLKYYYETGSNNSLLLSRSFPKSPS